MRKLFLLPTIFCMWFLFSFASADFLFTTDAGFSISAANYNKFDVLSTAGSGSYTKVFTSLSSILPQETNMDSLQTISSNTVIFSLGEDAVVQGTLFSKKDLIAWNGTTATLFWSGASNGGLPTEVNLDAAYVVALSPLEISFSLGEATQLVIASLTTQVSKSDLVRWKNGVGFTGKDFDASTRGVPLETNLDAFYSINSATQWILSFDAQALIPSNTSNLYAKSDLISYNPTSLSFTVSPFFNGTSNGLSAEVNIDGAANANPPVAIDDWYKMK